MRKSREGPALGSLLCARRWALPGRGKGVCRAHFTDVGSGAPCARDPAEATLPVGWACSLCLGPARGWALRLNLQQVPGLSLACRDGASVSCGEDLSRWDLHVGFLPKNGLQGDVLKFQPIETPFCKFKMLVNCLRNTRLFTQGVWVRMGS